MPREWLVSESASGSEAVSPAAAAGAAFIALPAVDGSEGAPKVMFESSVEFAMAPERV